MMENIMRTTVTLDEKLVRELLKISGAKTKTAAVSFAVKEHIRKAKLNRLASLLGNVDIDEQAIYEAEKADLNRTRWLEDMGKKNGK